MDIKWKSRIYIVIWCFLFTFGLSGIFSLFSYSDNYVHQDYFSTQEFRNEIDQFTEYLSMFELNNLTMEEAKKSITVSEEEINEHRYRYGDLPEQIENIKMQYESRIHEALSMDDQDAADAFIDERDAKIKDITKNFESDEYIKAKVIKMKEQNIEDYYKEREEYRPAFLRYKESFRYYFKDDTTGKVYTNLNLSEDESVKNKMNHDNMLFVTSYSISDDYYVHFTPLNSLIPSSTGTFDGQIAIPKSLASSNPIMVEYENYQQEQIIYWVFIVTSIIVLLLCFYFVKKAKGTRAHIETWRPYYNKLPIDIRIALFFVAGFVAIIHMFLINDRLRYILDYPLSFGIDIVVSVALASVFLGLTTIQWKFLIREMKDLQNVKKEWENGLSYKIGRDSKVLFYKVTHSLKEAFLNQSTGTQLFVVLGVVFGLGLAAITVVFHPVFIFFYMVLLGLVGIPIVMGLVNKIGYLNRIVEKTNELAIGNLGKDLQVLGNSILSSLAYNINVLKQGVKTSQTEQAKSERLKTELITNVSHDLRTPLTSIITYTQLLKAEEVSKEDSTAYLEIIDRKSKRLKMLIDDLFEVSKMASGNIQLTKEKVDLVQLLQQALAEYDDTIKDSSLHFRVTNIDNPVYALVDGQKIWRVFDNLIGNILKYSLENSRVYINLSTYDNQAIITFKNVSKYELNNNSDELFERFKRGDTSRHTEGSGLGLAIAESIIDLHEGSLQIETDGDLFKASIYLKLEE